MKETTIMQPSELKELINNTFTGRGKIKRAAQCANISERTLRRYLSHEAQTPQEVVDKLIIRHAVIDAETNENTKHIISTACQFSREHKTRRKLLLIKNAAYIICHGEVIAISAIRDDGTRSTPVYQP